MDGASSKGGDPFMILFIWNRPWEISLKDISCVDFVEDVIEARVISIGNDGLALRLELGEVVDDQG